jgi:SpoVK/Ycf46/Vps4 family AAA+-type ATPase
MKLSEFNDNKGKHSTNNSFGGNVPVTLTKGLLDCRRLPDADFMALWDAIVLDRSVKDRLLSQAVLNFTLRPRIHRSDLPLHGIILLVGEPGTGKTSLARGLAARTAETLKTLGKFLYLEVEPHALASAALGKSQKAVTELLGSTIAEYAAMQPLIVLLDEVETLAANRSKMSMEANPVDVHRATDAVLAQLDQLAAKYPQLLFLATSNFPAAIDEAFLSRADLVMTIEPPGPEACKEILISTLEAVAIAFPNVKDIPSQPEFAKVVESCQGLDGRRIRKLVATACTFYKETALDPNRLSARDLVRAAEHAQKEAKTAKRMNP